MLSYIRLRSETLLIFMFSLWLELQTESIGTIRTNANVCSVQFAPDSSHSLAISSADHNIYCYDLRNFTVPHRTLIGHAKTVSYVKFLDSTTIVSASTDNTLKLWDLSLCASGVIDDPLQTFTGHTNVKVTNHCKIQFVNVCSIVITDMKAHHALFFFSFFPQNFVGLSLSDGYIATGSETNEVCFYVMCCLIH